MVHSFARNRVCHVVVVVVVVFSFDFAKAKHDWFFLSFLKSYGIPFVYLGTGKNHFSLNK